MPRELVAELINKYKTNDPFELASIAGINVFPWSLHEDIKGFYKYIRKSKYIFYNMDIDERMKNFVCAHELGHALIHPRANTPFLRAKTFFSIERIEIEANTFAVELLLPDQVVHEHTDVGFSIREIANMYGVPNEVSHLKKCEYS